jgi:hypothetical protein
MSFKAARVESLRGANETWHDVGTTNDFGVTFQNSWANTGGGLAPAGFYKDKFNIVHLRGVIDTGTTGTVAFTLPVGYRPEYDHYQVQVNNNGGPGPGGASCYVTVASTGTVTPVFGAGSDMTLSGIHFRAD